MRQISDIAGFVEHPVKGLSATFAVLFTISGILHGWQISKYRCWGLTWVVPPACILFTAGFVCREYMAYYPTSNMLSAVQGLLYSAVPVISTTLYFLVIWRITQHRAVMSTHPRRLCTAAGVYFSVLISLTAQGTSSVFSPESSNSTVNSGLQLLQASLILQLCLNVGIVLIFLAFRHRVSSRGISQIGVEAQQEIYDIYVLVTLVIIRNIFRTVQIFMPSDSPIWTAEAYFWVLDALPMLAYTLLLNLLNPGRYYCSLLRNERRAEAASPVPEPFDDVEVGGRGRDAPVNQQKMTIKLRPIGDDS